MGIFVTVMLRFSVTKKDENKGDDYSNKPGSGKDKKVLQAVNTRLFVGTEVCWLCLKR